MSDSGTEEEGKKYKRIYEHGLLNVAPDEVPDFRCFLAKIIIDIVLSSNLFSV